MKKLLVIVFLMAASFVWSADKTPPKGFMEIKKEHKQTKTRTVKLTLNAVDANGISKICVSNNEHCKHWVPYQRETLWVLPSGNGQKTVHFYVQDRAGNVSHVTDSIQLQE